MPSRREQRNSTRRRLIRLRSRSTANW
jgi:hypothetical protein